MKRVYRMLLYLFPASFRAEYGEEMFAIYNRRPGIRGLLSVFIDALASHWDILRQDLHYTVRSLKQSPGFTITAILVVAIGIGANTAVFSMTDHVLLRPLPFPDSERIVTLWESLPGYGRSEASAPNYRDWKRLNSSFEAMPAYRGLSVNLVGQGEPVRVDGAAMTFDLLPMLGVQPVQGRVFDESDDRETSSPTVLIGYRLWQSVFGKDPGLIGKTVRLDDAPYTVIGVMPAEFNYPNRDAQLWTPMRFSTQDFAERGSNHYLHVMGKLKPLVTLQLAQAEMTTIASQLEQQYPKDNKNAGINVFALRDDVSRQSRMLLKALFGAAIGVLLIACTNLAGLLLSRASTRQKEVAVRTALGAGKERLVRQLLTESLTLSILGGILGVFIAAAALPVLVKLIPTSLPIAEVPSIDLRVLSFGTLLTGLTGIAFGCVPAIRVCRKADLSGLREGARSGVGGRKETFRSALVVAEVSISVVLLVSAGLLLRALYNVQDTDTGFRHDGVITMRTVLPMPRFEKTATRVSYYTRVLDEIRALPNVEQAGYTSFLPFVMRGGVWPVVVDGYDLKPGSPPSVATSRFITPGFFATMGIAKRAGRDVEESDTQDSQKVAVVSESFARRYWPGQDPIGRRFSTIGYDRTIVGVVADIRVRGLESSSEPQMYFPYKQVRDAGNVWYAPKDLVILTSAEMGTILPAVRRIIHNADPEIPISDVQMLSDLIDAETAPRRVQVRVLGTFALVAILLAAIGIHGLLSFSVTQRTNEIGVRIALGAQSRDIISMVSNKTLQLAGIGIVLGVILAYVAGRTLQSLLAGVAPSDAFTFAIAIAVAGVMSMAGTLIPAIRAVRVDPLEAIHVE